MYNLALLSLLLLCINGFTAAFEWNETNSTCDVFATQIQQCGNMFQRNFQMNFPPSSDQSKNTVPKQMSDIIINVRTNSSVQGSFRKLCTIGKYFWNCTSNVSSECFESHFFRKYMNWDWVDASLFTVSIFNMEHLCDDVDPIGSLESLANCTDSLSLDMLVAAGLCNDDSAKKFEEINRKNETLTEKLLCQILLKTFQCRLDQTEKQCGKQAAIASCNKLKLLFIASNDLRRDCYYPVKCQGGYSW